METTPGHFVSVILPALNEEMPIAEVVRDGLATKVPGEVHVVDDECTDSTAERAAKTAARVAGGDRGTARSPEQGKR